MQLNEVMYHGKKLAYRKLGTGKPVVLLHGFGEDGNIWNQQAEALQNDFQLIIPHLPGSGSSEMADDMSMEGLAASVHYILQKENIDQCSMIGHSMGGYITLAFAANYEHTLNRIGLFHSTAYADSEEKKGTREKGIQFIQQHGAHVFLKTSIPNLYSPATKENHFSLLEQHIAAVDYFSEAALVAYYRSMINRPDRTSILKQTTLPVLFILGQYDAAVPLEDGLKQCHLPYLSYIHILSASGHMGMLEETEHSNQILKTFLSATI